MSDPPVAGILPPDDGTIAPWVEGALQAIERPQSAPELPIDVHGTAFQEAVWKELRKIPAGETRSYADIAAAIGDPKATRAVGVWRADSGMGASFMQTAGDG